MMQKALVALLFVITSPAVAQEPYLVRDINLTGNLYGPSSSPASFMGYGNRVYFTATTPAEGAELWSTDETAAGTNVVADIIPGRVGSNATPFAVVNGKFLFTARDSNHGYELWTTDGTAAGTRLFMDINPGPSSASPSGAFLYDDGVLLFVADDGVNGRELWCSDGTPEGTVLVKDIAPEAADSSPADFVQMRGIVYFLADGALWRSDGTEAGTSRVAGGLAARKLVATRSRLFFEGFDSRGWELWSSDGTESGTRMLADIRPGKYGAFDGNTRGFAALNFRVLFAANDGAHGTKLWSSDGTVAGTRPVRDIVPGHDWAILRGRAYFGVSTGTYATQLWRSDGTPQGTALVFAFDRLEPHRFAVAGNQFFFAGQGWNEGERGLWVSDGSTAGTRLLAGADASAPLSHGEGRIWPVDGKVFLAGRQQFHSIEPWVSDGTDSGTRMIAEIGVEDAPSSYPGGLTAAGNLLFFQATENAGPSKTGARSLWRSDGTAGGTFKVLDDVSDNTELLGAGPLVFFERWGGPVVLWQSDGTVDGTHPAADFVGRFNKYGFDNLTPVGETIFATVSDGGFYEPSSLWKTSVAPGAKAIRLGSSSPLSMSDITYGRRSLTVTELAGRYYFFAAPKGSYDRWGLWTTDGTPEGTYPIIPRLIESDEPIELSRIVNAGGTLFFLLRRPYRGGIGALYRSDGTPAGTMPVKQLPYIVNDLLLKAAGNKVFFAVYRDFWTSDGTESGTIELGKFDWTYGIRFNAAGDRMIFLPWNTSRGSEVWSSDGTREGTRFLRFLQSWELVSVGDTLYFTGDDPEHGTEPWATDGTPEGTRMLFDLEPGPASSSPSQFTKAGDLLYFYAKTSRNGGELWALPLKPH